MRVKNHTPGQIRYFTYYLIFPKDKDVWVDQVPFVHPLSYELKRTTFGKNPEVARTIMKNGECHWKDHNGVTHRVVVEEEVRAKNWGVKKPALFKGAV
jgi:hypothetical protein